MWQLVWFIFCSIALRYRFAVRIGKGTSSEQHPVFPEGPWVYLWSLWQQHTLVLLESHCTVHKWTVLVSLWVHVNRGTRGHLWLAPNHSISRKLQLDSQIQDAMMKEKPLWKKKTHSHVTTIMILMGSWWNVEISSSESPTSWHCLLLLVDV